MSELTHFYNLFAKDHHNVQTQHTSLQFILETVMQTLSPKKTRTLECTPSKEELHKTLKLMAKGRSPGIDDLTSEVFSSCWHFIENDFFNILIIFWEIDQLYPGFNGGVLKLIPQKWIDNKSRTGGRLLC